MIEWLTLPLHLVVFYGIGVVATLALMLQLLLTFLGFDTDGADAGDGLGLFSFRSIAGFLGGLGWGAGIALEHGAPVPVATVIGIVAGCSLMLVIAGGIRFLYSLRESGNLDYQNAIGKIGTVYIPIPAAEQGPGRIWIEIQGRLTEITAFTRHDETIPGQRKVEVLALVDESTVMVAPLSPVNSTPNRKGVSSHV